MGNYLIKMQVAAVPFFQYLAFFLPPAYSNSTIYTSLPNTCIPILMTWAVPTEVKGTALPFFRNKLAR